ncbi:MAG: aspartate kinase [Peptococcaceae bacterium]|nr:aspartate kinase [Peptococcaceae bacterium]
MKFIILKFGGTSLVNNDLRGKVVSRVLETREQGYVPLVVVSAIGRKGEPYATDTLLSYAQVEGQELSPRESDLLMHCGEIISGVIMVATLEKMGYPAVLLTGAQAGIITSAEHNNSKILKINPENIFKYVQDGKVVVVTGFQGVTEEGEITTLGRGGSDTTAVALGVALNAERVDIYTDVEGIMTADPRIVTDARLLQMVTYNEICQLAREGARVIHPRAVEIARQKNIPLRIRCTFGDAPGTLVIHERPHPGIDITRDRTVTGITHIQDITQVRISTEDVVNVPDFQKSIFQALAQAQISIDFINVCPQAVVFTIKNSVVAGVLQVLDSMGICAEIFPDCAKVAAVGAAMTGVPGVMAGIVAALAREKVQILQSADSYTTIWVLVRNEDMEKSIRALHRQFGNEM